MSCLNFVKCTAGFRGGRRGRGGVGLSEKGEEQVCGKGLFLLFGMSQAGIPLWCLGATGCCAGVVRGPRGSGWLPAASGTEARRKAAGAQQRGCRAAQGAEGGGDAEPGLPSRPGPRALGGVGTRLSRAGPPPWGLTFPTQGGGPGTWHGRSVDVHLLEEAQGLQGLCHLGSGHVLPLPPARAQRCEAESGPRERGREGKGSGVRSGHQEVMRKQCSGRDRRAGELGRGQRFGS